MSIDKLTAALYDRTASTAIGPLAGADNVEVRREVSQRGNAKFRIPLTDAASLDFDCVVKFSWRGSIIGACVIDSEAGELVVNGKTWLVYDNQPGLLAMLDWANIPPEYGLNRRSGDTRLFGFMSKRGAWYIDANWVTPMGVAYEDEIPPRKNHPPEMRGTGAYWLAADPGPDVTVAAGTKNWFRYEHSEVDDFNVRVVWTGDNFVKAYSDGEQYGFPDPSDQWMWRSAEKQDLTIFAGDHVWAWEVENAPPVAGHTYNPIGLMVVVYKLNNKGEEDGILFKSDPSDPGWSVCKIQPGWHKGQAIYTGMSEAQDRGVDGANALTMTFTGTHDSNGDPYDDEVGEFAVDVENTSLSDWIISLCEHGVNVDVDPADNTLNVYNRKGADKYSDPDAEFKLAKAGGSLLSFRPTAASSRATTTAAHLEDRTWIVEEDTDAIDDVGRKEIGYAFGTASNAPTARAFAREQLAESARPQVQMTGAASTLRGPQYPTDVDLGDSCKTPGRRGTGHMKGRILSVTLSWNTQKQRVDVAFDFMQDLT